MLELNEARAAIERLKAELGAAEARHDDANARVEHVLRTNEQLAASLREAETKQDELRAAQNAERARHECVEQQLRARIARLEVVLRQARGEVVALPGQAD